MNKEILTEYADYLLNIALYKTGNIADAEDLVQDTLMAALSRISGGKTIENPKSWLSSVLNRRFYDNLRRKYRKPVVCIDAVQEQAAEDNISEDIEKNEEAENIRRCVGMLTKNYREAIVRHYMNGESVSDIAKALDIPVNTVKTRLYTGRKHIGKEFSMENYAKQSYQPENLYIASSGRIGFNEEPFCFIKSDDRITQNLLILAYEKPVTVPDLAKAIGISTVYIEPIVDRLAEAELMKRVGDRVYTDFIICTEKDRTANLEAEIKIADGEYKNIWEIMEQGLAELRQQDFYRSQRKMQQDKLESFFAIRTMQGAVNNVRDEACGGKQPFEDYPDRPNGGKWYAIGNRYPADYDYNDQAYALYSLSGEYAETFENFSDTKKLSICEYDTDTGAMGRVHWSAATTSHENVAKMLYSVYTDNKDCFGTVSRSCIEKVDAFISLNYLSRENGKLVCEVPVISMADRWKMYELSEKWDNLISEGFHDVFMRVMKNPVILPPHLKSVPNWLRYMDCCSKLPMAVIVKAKDNGLFLNNAAFPSTGVFLAVEK
ncbi:MAG: sigma-70 family RNA polymerase sigma factor [Bacteroides sp.]|nr:sigma-70 family RNA polymerase sigma factor [Bacteroides sp.]